MAETIGRAYVKILADGSGLGPDVERQLREHEGAFRASGRRDSKAYVEEFKKGLEDDPSWQELTQAMNRGIARGDLSRDFFNSETWTNFEKDLDKNFGEAGRRAGINMRNEFIKEGKLGKEVIDDLENITPHIARATKEITDEVNKVNETFERDFRKSMDTIERDTRSALQGMSRDLDRHGSSLTRLNDDFRRGFIGVSKDFESFSAKVRKAAAETRDIVRDSDNHFKRLGQRIDEVGTLVAGVFGKGSRNDFLNIVGAIIGAMVKIPGAIAKGIGSAIEWFSQLGSSAAKAGGDVEKLGMQAEEAGATVSSALGEGAASTVAAGPAGIATTVAVMAGAFYLAAASAGILAGALSALAGIIVALAGTLAGVLGGAVLIVGPLLAALAASIGGTILVVKALKDATGPLKEGLDNIKEAGKGIGDAFTDRALVNAPHLMERIANVTRGLKPLAKAAGDGFNALATNIVNALDSPAVHRFQQTMQKFLPDAMGTIGNIAGNLGKALSGIFTAASPAAQRFLNWLEDLTSKFADWANSGKGQNTIKDFLDKAADSAESVWHFIVNLIKLVGDLLSSGQPTGDSLFTTMGDKFQEWSDWISTHGEEVKGWFSDAKNFAEDLGKAITLIADAFDRLDTPQNRKWAGDLVIAIGAAIDAAAMMIEWGTKIFNALKYAAGGPVLIKAAFDAIKGPIGTVFNSIKTAASQLVGPIVGFFTGIALKVLSALRSIMNGAFAVVRGILGAWAKLPGPLGAPARAAQDDFENFARHANSDLDSVEGSIKQVQTMADNPMELQLSTAAAQEKIAGLLGAINHLFDVWGSPPIVHVPSAAPRSPSAVEHGVTSGSTGTVTGGPKPNVPTPGRTAAGVTINVTTPTKDPVGVANETVNRLVGIGYAN